MNFIKSFKQNLFHLNFYLCLFFMLSLSLNHALNADVRNPQNDDALELGFALETHFWNLVKKQKIEKFSSKLSPIFQGLNESGVYTRQDQIDGLTGAILTSFAINNPRSQRSRDTLVFSYDFVETGTLTGGPSVTVWKKKNGVWRIASHSYVHFE